MEFYKKKNRKGKASPGMDGGAKEKKLKNKSGKKRTRRFGVGKGTAGEGRGPWNCPPAEREKREARRAGKSGQRLKKPTSRGENSDNRMLKGGFERSLGRNATGGGWS